MWENTVVADRQQMAIWRMHFAFCLTKATGANSEYVISYLLLISNFRRVLYVVCFLLGNSPGVWILYADVSEHCLFHLHMLVGDEWQFITYQPMKMEQSVPKRRHIKFRRLGITQKKIYSYSLLFHGSNGYANAPWCYVMCTLPAKQKEFFMFMNMFTLRPWHNSSDQNRWSYFHEIRQIVTAKICRPFCGFVYICSVAATLLRTAINFPHFYPHTSTDRFESDAI